MTRWLRNASIRTKFLTLVMAVTTISLLLAAASLFAWDYRQFRLDIMKELSAQAGLVIENSTAAISFRDHRAATETLETLAPNTHIRLGCLYDGAGTLFAAFAPRHDGRVCPPQVPMRTDSITRDAIRVTERRPLSGRAAGSVYLESDTDAVADRVRVQAATVAFVLVLTVIVALVLSASFASVITGPVDALVSTAGAVSRGGDYSLRAGKTTGDELGVLVDAFNGMLGHIEHAEREREVMLAREREANRLKDEFLMTLSHELRTPLNAIQGWTNLLSAGAIPPSGIPAVLQKVERNVRAQARLLEDLLDVSRFAAGKFRLDPVPLDLVVITHQAIDALRATADAQGVSIDVDADIATAPLLGDPDRLQQVIWNLLSNAIKFSASSGRIACRLSTVNRLHEVVIADQGIGIAPDFLPLMFEPFRQADASTTRAHSGLGLGLAISRRIVEAHGGTIEATSAGTGHGSTFTLRLPASQTTPSAPDAARETTPPRGDELLGATILVADDDADSRELIKALLEGAGAHLCVAASAAEALQLARVSACDVLITDIAMPDQDGFALLAALRREPGVTPPRIAIALTAQVTPRYEQLTRDAGFQHHVAKPFNQHELIALIGQALHRR